MTGFLQNIGNSTADNELFRKVLFTGKHVQLVLMALQPNEDIGLEVHAEVDQFFRVESGVGTLLLSGEEHAIQDGDAFIVPAGVQHNVINTSTEHYLKLYTLYSPPQHPVGTEHASRAEAMSAEEDHS